MSNKEELIKEIHFLSTMYSGEKEDIILDISSDLLNRYTTMNLTECIEIVKKTV